MHSYTQVFQPFYANDTSNFVPEIWANASLAILEEEMVAANLVHRDFDNEIAVYGETVHTRKPSEFNAKRKTDADSVTTQDVSSTGVDVVLNQWIHVSFIIKDGERTKAFKDLVRIYLYPAMMANARLLDQAVLGQVMQFLGNREGGLGLLSSTTAKNYLIDLGALMDTLKVPAGNRNLVLAAQAKAEMLKTDIFHQASLRGDGGRALRTAELGHVFGFDTYMDINTPKVDPHAQTVATVTSTAAYPAGTSTLVLSAPTVVGQYLNIAGDATAIRVATLSTNTITTTRSTKRSVASGAVVTQFKTQAVNNASNYANGWTKEIDVDGANATPHVGQLVSFNDTGGSTYRTPEYTICQVTYVSGTEYLILLDRPLETALNDNDVVNYGPIGYYNFAFQREAVALVNRPLALPMAGVGAQGAIAAHNGMSMRVVITYDGEAQGHRVTLDSLFGVKALETAKGAVLYG